MFKILAIIIGLFFSQGIHTFYLPASLSPEQILLFSRSVDFFNKKFGCSLLGFKIDIGTDNTYNFINPNNSLVVLQDVSKVSGVSPEALAFTDGILNHKRKYGVHLAINSSRSYPSLSMMFNSNNDKWSNWDWALTRIVLHEFGHAFGLKDDESAAGSIMRGMEDESDQSPIDSMEINQFNDSIRSHGTQCH